jgi:ubiquinone/menaquinone biosynthesis C-methylase UbiE
MSRQSRINTYYSLMPSFLYDWVMKKGGHLEVAIDLVQKLRIQENDFILDVPVGTGLSLGLYPPTTRVTVVDIHQKMIARSRNVAKKLGRSIEFVLADAKSLPFDESSYDKVVVMAGLSAIPENHLVLPELYRVTKPEGLIGINDILFSFNAPGQVKLDLAELIKSFSREHNVEIVYQRKFPQIIGNTDFSVANYILKVKKNNPLE